MDLYFCEKPSQAKDLGAVLGATVRKNGYFEHPTKNIKVTYAVGHMLELFMPDAYDPALKQWSIESLPIVPDVWKYGVKSSTATQLKAIKNLFSQATTLFIATDYDREGESIARTVIDRLKFTGNIKRVCLRSLDEVSIRSALSDIKDGSETISLYYSAMARSRADWLVGVNFSRMWTVLARNSGFNETLHIGRVQTPMVNLVCMRDKEISDFTPSPFYVLSVDVSVQNGQFKAGWVPGHGGDGFTDDEGRCVNKTMAEQVAHQINGKHGVITKAETKLSKEAAPLPFSLLALQQYASKKWGYTAQDVLATTQSLYENKKAVTYPRSGSRHLPMSQHADASLILQNILKSDSSVTGLVAGADPTRRSRAFNDKKVDAHHAIIPTQSIVDVTQMSEKEFRIYDAIRRHYIAQFYTDFEFNKTNIDVECEGHRFTTMGKVPIKQGWKVLIGNDTGEDNEGSDDENLSNQTLPKVNEGEPGLISSPDLVSKMTRPSPHFTDATLLAAMANISKYVTEAKFKKILAETAGLGTEATRGSIIEGAVSKGYLVRDKKRIIASQKAHALMSILPPVIVNPSLTAAWEQELERIEAGTQTMTAFMDKITGWVGHIVSQGQAQTINKSTFADSRTKHECQKCGSEIVRRKRKKDSSVFWVCKSDACNTFYDDKAGKPVAQKEKEVAPMCPACAFPMVKRKYKPEGRIRATSFWGCTKYREGCRGKLSLADAKKLIK